MRSNTKTNQANFFPQIRFFVLYNLIASSKALLNCKEIVSLEGKW